MEQKRWDIEFPPYRSSWDYYESFEEKEEAGEEERAQVEIWRTSCTT
jgi:hypothetical protein